MQPPKVTLSAIGKWPARCAWGQLRASDLEVEEGAVATRTLVWTGWSMLLLIEWGSNTRKLIHPFPCFRDGCANDNEWHL